MSYQRSPNAQDVHICTLLIIAISWLQGERTKAKYIECKYMGWYKPLYTTSAWAFKGAAQGLTHILTGKNGLPMTLMPSQFKETIRLDSY